MALWWVPIAIAAGTKIYEEMTKDKPEKAPKTPYTRVNVNGQTFYGTGQPSRGDAGQVNPTTRGQIGSAVGAAGAALSTWLANKQQVDTDANKAAEKSPTAQGAQSSQLGAPAPYDSSKPMNARTVTLPNGARITIIENKSSGAGGMTGIANTPPGMDGGGDDWWKKMMPYANTGMGR